MKHMGHKASKLSGDKTILALFAVLIIVGLVNVAILAGVSLSAGQKSLQQKTAAEPAKIQVVEISAPSCSNCYNTTSLMAQINSMNVNASERSILLSSAEANSLMLKYGIDRLPALVVTGEINKTLQLSGLWSQVGTVSNGVVVVKPQAPYYSVSSSKVVGLVTLTRILDSSCTQCSSIDGIISAFKRYGVVVTGDTFLEYNSAEGKSLMNQFSIQRIPAVIVSRDILSYPAIAQIWPQLNATENNGGYALHVLQPPYRDISENRTVGLLDVIYLNDSSCTSCYDVLIHKNILTGSFGAVLGNETVLDAGSAAGKALISKYSIKLVPTFVMSSEAKYYSALTQVWPPVGDQVNGWYVFRNLSVLNLPYKNLDTGKVIVPGNSSAP